MSQQHSSGGQGRDRVTAIQCTLLTVAIGLAVVGAAGFGLSWPVGAQAPAGPAGQGGPVGQGGPGGPGGPGGFGGPGGRGFMPGEQKVVARFDSNKDDRLDADERKAAREWLAANASGRRGFGGRGGRGLEPGSPGRTLTPADVKAHPTAPLYDLGTLRTIFLRFEHDDWEQELAAFNNTDVEVPATAIVDGATYKDVGVHFRGASSFMMVPEGSKRSLNLSFDFGNKKQRLHGYRTLNLLNGNSDPTFVRTVLYSEIARAYLPAPRANFVRVVINGESWGVYVNAQQYNSDFLRDYFKTEKGARWKVPGSPGGRGGMEYLGDAPSAYTRTYEIKTKDDPKAWADMIRMFRVLNETPPGQLEAALSPLLDVDGALRFLAVEMALVNTDGYWTRASDYSIYQDVSGKFHVLPHDMNEALLSEGGRGGRGPGGGPGGLRPGAPDGPGGPGRPGGPPPEFARGPGGGRGFGARPSPELDPLAGLDDPTKPLRSKLLAVPALRERYLGYVRDIAERWLDWTTLEPRLKDYQRLIADDVKTDTRKLYSYEAFQSGLNGPENSLKTFVESRRAYLLAATAKK